MGQLGMGKREGGVDGLGHRVSPTTKINSILNEKNYDKVIHPCLTRFSKVRVGIISDIIYEPLTNIYVPRIYGHIETIKKDVYTREDLVV
jgi:hypothetical protein